MSYDPTGRWQQPQQPYSHPQQPPQGQVYGQPVSPAQWPPASPALSPVRRPWWPYALLAVAVLVLAGGLWTAYTKNLIFKDSGIKACEALRDGNSAIKNNGSNDKLTESQYRQMRAIFEDSRYDDIRDHGTKLMDVIWQMSQAVGDNSGASDDGSALGAAMMYLQPLSEHMTGLQSACADQGIIFTLKPAS